MNRRLILYSGVIVVVILLCCPGRFAIVQQAPEPYLTADSRFGQQRVKPVNFERFVAAVGDLGFYWLLLNHPPRSEGCGEIAFKKENDTHSAGIGVERKRLQSRTREHFEKSGLSVSFGFWS